MCLGRIVFINYYKIVYQIMHIKGMYADQSCKITHIKYILYSESRRLIERLKSAY